MLVFNQQANIKNVNGAIADIFANRPAPQSTFYLFYATDTQEIYYDNGAWILLGSGGGGGTNIYNSDGTLTGNRVLSGANNDLTFADLDVFKTSLGGNDVGLKLDFANDLYSFGNINGMMFVTYTNQSYIAFNSQDPAFVVYSNYEVQLGDVTGFQNGVGLFVQDQNQIISTKKSGADIGLKLDFANNIYEFGKFNDNYLKIDATNGLIDLGYDNAQILFRVDNINANVKIGDFNAFNNRTFLLIDDANRIIKTSYAGNDIGLKLDFANNLYQLGEYTGGNYGISLNINNFGVQSVLTIEDFFGGNNLFSITTDNSGIVNSTRLDINDIISIIKSQYQGNDIGLKLDFANNVFQFGDFSTINNFGEITIAGNDVRIQGGGNNPLISIENTNSLIKTRFSGSDNGVYLDFSNEIYRIGQITGSNTSQLVVDDSNEQVYTTFGGNAKGIVLDAASNIYQFGRITGGNTTYIEIADANAYPVQISGTNVTAGTAGGASGLHLKIKINGVDYKIELRNP